MPSTGFHTPSKAHLSAGFRMANRTYFFNKLPHMPNGTHASDRLPYAKQEGIDCLNVRLTVRTRISCKIDVMFA